MNIFLTELGKNLATRWAAALALPGAVFVAVVVVAITLGPAHALDVDLLRTRATAATTMPTAAVPLAIAGFLAATAAVGLIVDALGGLVTAAWGLTGSGVMRPLAALRREWWRRASARADREIQALLVDTGNQHARTRTRRAVLRRDRFALAEPTCPTWAGDRLRATDDRVHRRTGLDLPTAWPHLWLLIPDTARMEVTAVQQRCASAARTRIWGLLYLAVTPLWWPAIVPGPVILLVAGQRIRRTVDVYADLVEAAVDLYARDLATQLGLDAAERMTPQLGEEITDLLLKPDHPKKA